MTLKTLAAAAVFALASATASSALTVTFSLSSNSDGGGVISGTFDFDTVLATYANINIATTGGSNVPATTLNFLGPFATADRLTFTSSNAPDLSGATLFDMGLSASLTTANAVGDTFGVTFGAIYICENAPCNFIAFGPTSRGLFGTSSVTVTEVSAVPLPAGGFLLLSGIGGVAALKRQKKRAA